MPPSCQAAVAHPLEIDPEDKAVCLLHLNWTPPLQAPVKRQHSNHTGMELNGCCGSAFYWGVRILGCRLLGEVAKHRVDRLHSFLATGLWDTSFRGSKTQPKKGVPAHVFPGKKWPGVGAEVVILRFLCTEMQL